MSYTNNVVQETKNLKSKLMDSLAGNLFSKGKNIVTEKIMGRYGFSIMVTRSDAGESRVSAANDWIKQHDPKFESRLQNPLSKKLKNTQFLFKLEKDTYCFVSVGKTMLTDLDIAISFYSGRNDEGGIYHSSDMSIYIFGRESKRYYNSLKKALEKCGEGLYIYNVSGSSYKGGDDRIVEEFNSIVSDMHQRQIDTLFYNHGIKEQIIHHIDSFLANEPIYVERDLLFKTGLLFFGEPGTGKTSLATAIATYYNSCLIVIDMTTFRGLNTNTLAQSINADKTRYVILLEDIDCIFDTLNREDANIDKDDKATLQKLLQFLDSSSSPSNVIFIATTNHPEKLDDAIMRDGRFDLKIEVGGIDKATARKMCQSFNMQESDIDETLEKIEQNINGMINQAKLQNAILSKVKLGSDEIIDIDEYEISKKVAEEEQKESENPSGTSDVLAKFAGTFTED